MHKKSILLFALGLLVVGSVPLTLSLVKQNQDLRQEASTDARLPLGETLTCTVTGHTDGDTFQCNANNQQSYSIRLIGVDAPEKNPWVWSRDNSLQPKECYGEESSQWLKENLPTGTTVILRWESERPYDNDGRLLAYVELADGSDLANTMLGKGIAAPDQANNNPRQIELAKEARGKKLGLWNRCQRPGHNGKFPHDNLTPTTSQALSCDFNSDNIVNLDDYLFWLTAMRSGATAQIADCTGDGTTEIFDYAKWLSIYRAQNS